MKNRIPSIVIALAFLAYGLLRVTVGSGMILRALGYINVADFQEPLADATRWTQRL